MARFRTAVVCVALGLFGAGIVAAVMAAPAPAARGKVKWEYKALSRHQMDDMAPKGSKDKLTDTLNQLGDEGWELVTVEALTQSSGFNSSQIGTRSTYVFKRPK